MHCGEPTDYTLEMVQPRRSLPSLCLALLMGLSLAWQHLAHRRFHESREHFHEHFEERGIGSLSTRVVGSESHPAEHPHLDLTATAPTKAGLHLAFLVSQYLALPEFRTAEVRVSTTAADSIQPRGPPPGPPPSIRAPPTA